MAALTAATMFGLVALAQTVVVDPTAAPSVTATTTSATVAEGTISEFGPTAIVVRSTTAAAPTRYVYRKTTTYVDEAGAPVSIETVKSGLPVTVHYIREGNDMIASRVVVHRAVQPAPTVVEKRSTTTTTTKKVRKDDDDDDDKD
jgi:hypothetical protein